MTVEPSAVVQSLVRIGDPIREEAESFAPANIALCKYWGKRDEILKLPRTGSLSVSLGKLGTHMSIRVDRRDSLRINDLDIPPSDKAFRRLFAFLDLMRPTHLHLSVDSINTIPMAAGLASSASAFAAATLALNELFGWRADGRVLSILARMGSGSACRSIYEGFVEWKAGERRDGMDSYAEPVAPLWPNLRIGIVAVSESQKPVGSSEGMRRTMETSMLYQGWPEQVARDLPRIRTAILANDFLTLGATAENNALAMHATMIAAWPPVLYWRPETVAVLHRVHELRRDGVPVYATLDAGPNVKLLFLADSTARLRREFPGLTISP